MEGLFYAFAWLLSVTVCLADLASSYLEGNLASSLFPLHLLLFSYSSLSAFSAFPDTYTHSLPFIFFLSLFSWPSPPRWLTFFKYLGSLNLFFFYFLVVCTSLLIVCEFHSQFILLFLEFLLFHAYLMVFMTCLLLFS